MFRLKPFEKEWKLQYSKPEKFLLSVQEHCMFDGRVLVTHDRTTVTKKREKWDVYPILQLIPHVYQPGKWEIFSNFGSELICS